MFRKEDACIVERSFIHGKVLNCQHLIVNIWRNRKGTRCYIGCTELGIECRNLMMFVLALSLAVADLIRKSIIITISVGLNEIFYYGFENFGYFEICQIIEHRPGECGYGIFLMMLQLSHCKRCSLVHEDATNLFFFFKIIFPRML